MNERLPDEAPGSRGRQPRPASPVPTPVREMLAQNPTEPAVEVKPGGEASAAAAEGGAPAPATEHGERAGIEPPAGERAFTVQEETWHARLSGRGAGGTGVTARACLAAVHFYRTAGARHPEREALAALPYGLDALYDEELAALLAASMPVPPLSHDAR